MKIDIDLRNKEEQEDIERVLLPTGTYFAEIDNVDDKDDKGGPRFGPTGYFMPNITFRILAKETTEPELLGLERPEDDSDNVIDLNKTYQYTGSLAWENLHFHPKLEGRNVRFLKATEQPLVNFDTDDWKGKKLRIRIKHEEYKGETKHRVGSFLYWSIAEQERLQKLYDQPENIPITASAEGDDGGL